MTIKKLINEPEDVVEEATQGLLLTHPTTLLRIQGLHVVLRADYDVVKRRGHVALLSGGGSGHEPAHAGFIGEGMLTGAVLGGVFASPSVSSILAAIRVVTGPAGCLLIVKNYTGDRLNFGMAREQALSEGMKVDMVIVADDCALPKEKGITGRRGVAGTVFVHKVAGAVAASGLSLEEVKAEADKCAEAMGSLGIALTTCTVPGSAPSSRLAGDVIEIGMGIHGEPGMEQCPMKKADELAERMATAIVDSGYLPLSAEEHVVVLINNLGATPPIEVSIVTRHVVTFLHSHFRVSIDRVFTGPFMTSLEMAGVSLTILKVDPLRLSRLDAPTSAPGWLPASPRPSSSSDLSSLSIPLPTSTSTTTTTTSSPSSPPLSTEVLGRYRAMTSAAAEALILAKEELNRLDGVGGDGDCGVTLERGAKDVLEQLVHSEKADGSPTDAATFIGAVGGAVGESMGGSSGVLLQIFFTVVSRGLRQASSSSSPPEEGPGLLAWAKAFKEGVDALSLYGGAKPGYRTMIDALVPAAEALMSTQGDWKEALRRAAEAARAGAESTKSMEALAGRANYVPAERLRGHADPGAVAVAVVMEVMAEEAATAPGRR